MEGSQLGLRAQLGQPRVQRTRLRRARTEARKSRATFAYQVLGQPRRAADATVRRLSMACLLLVEAKFFSDREVTDF